MASWMSASVVMILLWLCEAVFYPFVRAILLDLLLRVNNLRPRCWHCADVFLCVMSHRRERLSAAVSQDAAEIWPNLFSFTNSFLLKLNISTAPLNRKGRLYHNLICPNVLHSALNLCITAPISENSKLEHTANSAINVNVKHAYCSADRMEGKKILTPDTTLFLWVY